MVRVILGVIGGLVAWTLIVTVLDIGLRHAIPGYAAAEPTMDFTLAMMIARLAMAVVTSLLAGLAVRTIAPASRWAPWIAGLIAVSLFLPAHVHFWPLFPIWYHLFFLGTLAPLMALGARAKSRIRPDLPSVTPVRSHDKAAFPSA
ncbi:MAG TPA: hypothetical protein VKS60_04665 [Stellaceae bacterium]|nr:hypothetical protein [Stellaceae bacterium]